MVPTITIDGFSGVGKGAVSLQVARALSWHYLDSGVFYRLLALVANEKNIAVQDEARLAKLAESIFPEFEIRETSNSIKLGVIWKNKEISELLRMEICGLQAAQIAVHPAVRAALIALQRQCRKEPGLVADGRDMGHIVFPDALYKFLLTASPDVRAKRRCIQLKHQQNCVNFMEVKNAIIQRDQVDRIQLAPMFNARSDICIIDTTHLSLAEVVAVMARKLSAVGLYFN